MLASVYRTKSGSERLPHRFVQRLRPQVGGADRVGVVDDGGAARLVPADRHCEAEREDEPDESEQRTLDDAERLAQRLAVMAQRPPAQSPRNVAPNMMPASTSASCQLFSVKNTDSFRAGRSPEPSGGTEEPANNTRPRRHPATRDAPTRLWEPPQGGARPIDAICGDRAGVRCCRKQNGGPPSPVSCGPARHRARACSLPCRARPASDSFARRRAPVCASCDRGRGDLRS